MSGSRRLDIDVLQRELDEAGIVFHWCCKLFGVLGLNPMSVNKPLYVWTLFYSIMQLVMNFINIPYSMKGNVSALIENYTEGISMIGVIMKLLVYMYQRPKLVKIVMDILQDYTTDKYSSDREVRLFVSHVLRAKNFFKFVVVFGIMAPLLYYLRVFVIYGVGIPTDTDPFTNQTVYILPYRIRFYYPLINPKGYFCAMVYGMMMMPVTGFAMVADSAMLVAMLAHVCGQLSVLSRFSFHLIAEDARQFRRKAALAVSEHIRIVKLTKSIDAAFNLLLLLQVAAITFFLCMVGYQSIMNWDRRETTADTLLMLCFGSFALSMTVLLYGYCYVGQSLIDESLYIVDMLYDSSWYKLEPADMRYYVILLNYARNPLVITGGGFYVYSRENFMSVVKTAMAYLSVLRTTVQ